MATDRGPLSTLPGRSYTCDFPEVATQLCPRPYKEDDVNAVEQEVQRVGSPAVQAPVVTPATDADVFNHAADILEEFDWRQGSLGCRGEGSMCAAGAIAEAAQDYGIVWLDKRLRGLFATFGTPTREAAKLPLAVWNDAPGRTKAEVVARLREAAERSEHE